MVTRIAVLLVAAAGCSTVAHAQVAVEYTMGAAHSAAIAKRMTGISDRINRQAAEKLRNAPPTSQSAGSRSKPATASIRTAAEVTPAAEITVQGASAHNNASPHQKDTVKYSNTVTVSFDR